MQRSAGLRVINSTVTVFQGLNQGLKNDSFEQHI